MAAHLQQPRRDQLGADLDPLRVGLLLLGQRPCPSRQPALVHHRRSGARSGRAAAATAHYDLGRRLAPATRPGARAATRAARRHGRSTGGPCGTLLRGCGAPLFGGALLLPRHPRGEALLNDERPATRRANGSRAFLGEVFDPGEAWRTRSEPGGSRAREAKPLSGGGAGRRPAPGESRYMAAGTRAMSPPLGGTHRAHGCITPQPDGDCGTGRASEPAPAGPGVHPRQPRRPSVATRRTGAATVGRTVRRVNPERRARSRS